MSFTRERSPIKRDNSDNLNNSSNLLTSDDYSNNTMANLTSIEISMAKDMLPEYSGGSKNLAYFIKQVETFIELLRKPDDNCVFNRLLFEQVKSKLSGEARCVLITSNCNRWSDLKEELLQKFGDPRSEELLVHDLTTCFQNHHQSYEQYFENIKIKLQTLLEHVSIRTPNTDIRISKENMYTYQALATFKAGILDPYCSHLLNLPVTSLEQALYECRKYDNEKSQITFMNFMRQQSKSGSFKPPAHLPMKPQGNHNFGNKNFTPPVNKFPTTPQFRPQWNNYPNSNPFRFANNNNRHLFNNNNFRGTTNNFPRGPVNIQPRPYVQNTNNNFARNHSNTLYKPTPMSVSTRNTYRPPPNGTIIQQPGRPTLVFEELTNIERDPNDPNNLNNEFDTVDADINYMENGDDLQNYAGYEFNEICENNPQDYPPENFHETASEQTST